MEEGLMKAQIGGIIHIFRQLGTEIKNKALDKSFNNDESIDWWDYLYLRKGGELQVENQGGPLRVLLP